MSDSTNAVFLSYASQDAEAAKRICESLRAAGVEVWFDQNELVGGDQWDAKIRGQIASCALFVPMISMNTQERLEGYFRREWKQAAARTHDMADEKVFLLPVVIDSVRDVDARVPAEFRAVQWTRLSGGESAAIFCARVKTLLAGESPAPLRAAATTLRTAIPPPGSSRWVKPALAGAVVVLIVLALTLLRRADRAATDKPSTSLPSAAVAGETLSPARKLANKALTAVRSNVSGPELGAAIKEAERAATMDDLDGEVWAISALVDLSAYEMSWDRSDQRRDAILAKVVKAKGLAPRAPLARYAEAKSLIRIDATPNALTAALEILEALRAEKPREPDADKILGLIGIAQQGQGRFEDAGRTLEQAGSDWANAASWAYLAGGNLPQALAMAKRQGIVDPIGGRIQEALVQFCRGDLAALQASLGDLPVAARVGEIALKSAFELAYLRRDGEALLESARRFPRPFFDNQLTMLTSRGYYFGQAYAWLGRSEAARAEWIEALRLVEERQAVDTTSEPLRVAHMFLLVRLGRSEDAARELILFRQQVHDSSSGPAVVGLLATLGRVDEALNEMEKVLMPRQDRWSCHPRFRCDPEYDPLRSNLRFQKILRDTLLPGAVPLDDPASETKS